MKKLNSKYTASTKRAGSVALLATVFWLMAASTALTRNFSIDWFTVDGGGGTSTGGVYSITSTIGQPDADGPLAGGNYSLTGGFWALSAVQTPGAPFLSIKRTSTNTVMVYWPSPSTGFSPQVGTGFPNPSWTAAAETVQDNGMIRYIIVNPPIGTRFYRLKYP